MDPSNKINRMLLKNHSCVRSDLLAILVLALILAAGFPSPASAQSTQVDDIAVETGFDDTLLGHHKRGRALLAADFDLDGRIDFYMGNPGDESFVVRNVLQPDGTTRFELVEVLVSGDLAWGAATADYDNDGDYDIFIAVGGNEGIGHDYLFQNLWIENGESLLTFLDVSVSAGIQGPVPPGDTQPLTTASAGAAWTDFNNDGFIDLFVNTNIIDGSSTVMGMPLAPSPPQLLGRNTLWMNNGDGTFQDVTDLSGLGASSEPTRHSTFIDIDNDGDRDLYESNFLTRNILWKNRLMETGNPTFLDVTTRFSSGPNEDLGYPLDTFASTMADFNNDGWQDIIAFRRGGGSEPGSPYGVGHAIFENNGGTSFANVVAASGLNTTFQPNFGVMGCQVGDISGDGSPDVYVGNGGPLVGQFNQLYISTNSPGTSPAFQDRSSLIDFAAPQDPNFPGVYPVYPYRTHGTVMVDIDGDGAVELGVLNGGPNLGPGTVREPNRLFEFQISPAPGFFKVQPVGDGITVSNDAIDTRVALTVRKGAGVPWTIYQTLLGSSAFSAQNGFELNFSTQDADTVDSVQIFWPDGSQETISTNLNIGDSITVHANPLAGNIASDLTIEENAGQLSLTWGPSCTITDTDYAVYQGTIGDFTSHDPVFCSTGGQTTTTFTSGPGNYYFLVVPRNSQREGAYGFAGFPNQRQPSLNACLPQAISGCN
jgi:hypothetical protein